MLPVSRIRGHKEWAPTRKSDPTYDMNWRRSRVASFKVPGAVTPPTPTPEPTHQEDDVMLVECQYTPEKRYFGLYSGGVLIGLGPGERKGFDQQVTAGATVLWVEPWTWDLMDRRGQQLVGDTLGKAQQQLLDAVKALTPQA